RRERRRELVRDVAVELGAEAIHVAEALVRGRELGDLLLEVGDDPPRLHPQALAGRVGARVEPLAMAAEILPDLPGEVARVDRLLDEPVAADGEARLLVPLGGDRDDRHAVERSLAPQAKRDLVA